MEVVDVYGQSRPRALLGKLVDLVVEPLTEVLRDFEHFSIRDQFHYIAGAVQNSRAMIAVLKVFFHTRAQRGIDLVIDEVRDFAPDFDTADLNHHWVYQGLTFCQSFPCDQAPSNPGASTSRICNRARKSLTFTFASEIPSAAAVS